jgi:hypothetical protein
VTSVGRSEALAAVALAVGARRELPGTLNLLAREDRSLRRLKGVAKRCSAGLPLTTALRKSGLIRRADAARLQDAPPEILAEELSALAERRTRILFGEWLSARLPLWGGLVATVPSLALGAVVALMSQSLYGGIWQTLTATATPRGDARWWITQACVVAAVTIVIALLWSLLRVIPGVRGMTIFSRDLARAHAAVRLLRAARAGSSARVLRRLTRRWAWLSSDVAVVKQAVSDAGGDTTTALMLLGVIPRRADGRPDWHVALAEAERTRMRSAAELTPWLALTLIIAGLLGFFIWGEGPVASGIVGEFLYVLEYSRLLDDKPVRMIGIGFMPEEIATAVRVGCLVLLNALAAVIMTHAINFLRWLFRCLIGKSLDWPIVADRVARALDRREDLDATLHALRYCVRRPMRWCLDLALSHREPLPGRRLSESGVVPKAQSTAIECCDTADLPALLRATIQQPEDHGSGIVIRQGIMIVIVAGMVYYLQWMFLANVMRRMEQIMRSLKIDDPWAATSRFMLKIAGIIIAVALVVALIATVVHLIGKRFGWWVALGGWARIARALVLRRLLGQGKSEVELARALRAISPQLPQSLEKSAEAGDVRGVFAAAGWPVGSVAELDRALARHLIARDRRRLRLAVCARVALPLILAVPVGLCAAGITLSLMLIQGEWVKIIRNSPGSPSAHVGTPAMLLMFWGSQRAQEEADKAIDAMREAGQLPILPADKPAK